MTKFHLSMSDYRNQNEASNPLNNGADDINYGFHELSHESIKNYDELEHLRFQPHKKKTGKTPQVNDKHESSKLFHITECKSDSGYSESAGFDSLSPIPKEIGTLSSPTSPPIHNSSLVLRSNKASGESSDERCFLWPDTGEYKTLHRNPDQSKLWLENNKNQRGEVDFLAVRDNVTSNLLSVMKKYEKRPEEVLTLKNRENNQWESELNSGQQVACETESYNDTKYTLIESQLQHQSVDMIEPIDVDTYIRHCRDSQVICHRDTTQEVVDINYLKIQHSQQPSYAQSEGYHSYVSSTDSTTNTPFLDRLRRDSEAMAQKSSISVWEDVSMEGRDSVVTTSSRDSASSSETLKWHGSISDVSISSSSLKAHRRLNIGHNNGYPSADNHFQRDEVVIGEDLQVVKKRNCSFVNQTSQPKSGNCNDAKLTTTNFNNNFLLGNMNSRDGATIGADSIRWKGIKKSSIATDETSASSLQNSSKQLIVHSSRVQTPQRHYSETILCLGLGNKRRNDQSLDNSIDATNNTNNSQTGQISTTILHPQQPFSVSSSKKVTKANKPLPLPLPSFPRHHRLHNHHDEIDKRDEEEQVRYTYLDPEKKHRVSDPTLKAIQKKALLSFYERHHQSFRHKDETQVNPPPRCDVSSSSRRASSASDYSSTHRRNNKVSQHNKSAPLSPKHRHSNSCGSLSNDLLGPMIIGSAISIDDWVPARPPKKPHLRTVYNERLPSPDLPLPSPPPVVDDEVFHSDDPLPPPPPELHNDSSSFEQNIDRPIMTRSLQNQEITTNGKSSQYKDNYSVDSNANDHHYHHHHPRQGDCHRPIDCSQRIRIIDNDTELIKNSSHFAIHEQHNDLNCKSITLGQTPQPQVPKNTLPRQNNDVSLRKLCSRYKYAKVGPLKLIEGNCPSSSISSMPPPLPPPLPPPPLIPRQNHASMFHLQTQDQSLNRYSDNNEYLSSSSDRPPILETSGGLANPVLINTQLTSRSSYPELHKPLSYSTRHQQNQPLKIYRNLKLHAKGVEHFSGYTQDKGVGVTDQLPNSTIRRDKNQCEIIQSASTSSVKTCTILNCSDREGSSDPHIIHNDYERRGEEIHDGANSLDSASGEHLEEGLTAQECMNGMVIVNDVFPRGIDEDSKNGKLDNIAENFEAKEFSLSSSSPGDINNSERKLCELKRGEFNDIETVRPGTTYTSRNYTDRQFDKTQSSILENAEDGMLYVNSLENEYKEVNMCLDRVVKRDSSSHFNVKESSLTYQNIQCNNTEQSTSSQQSNDMVRINTTLDVASQTETFDDNNSTSVNNSTRDVSMLRRQLPEEIECEEFSKTLVSQLGPNDELLSILMPDPDYKRSTDYVWDLFGSKTTFSYNSKSYNPGVHNASITRQKPEDITMFESETVPYCNISECRAKIISQYEDELKADQTEKIDGLSSSISDPQDLELQRKKEELVFRLDRKIFVLRAEQEAIREEDEMNEALGARVAMRMLTVARPVENSKFRLHVEEVGKITSLLLSLSGRLARVENALNGLHADHPDREILEGKRNKLLEQLEEAKVLKSNIDKRSFIISSILSKYLNDDEFADYQHFINMKMKLLMDSRELQDKVEQGQEQLSALKKTMS